MSNQTTFVAALMATTLLAGGIAAAAEHAEHQGAVAAQLTKTEQDFGKLSADGARAYQEMALTRVAIFEGNTGEAKKLVGEAEAALNKAKGDDANFIKADDSVAKAPGAASQSASQGKDWLPVNGVISLDEDYTANPTKTNAVAEANEHLRKGYRKAAVEKLKLADVGMSVVQALLPLQQTITNVHQASTLIDQGKFYEGSQELRKVQASARYEVATYIAGSGGKVTYSHMADLKGPQAGQQTATQTPIVTANGPEPYSAPDPQYAPMTSEPVFHAPAPSHVSLSDNQTVQGPAAGPEPYSAPVPQYKPMTSEPVFQQTK